LGLRFHNRFIAVSLTGLFLVSANAFADAAGVLNGAAAVIGASAGMVTAGIAAGADKAVAAINAKANVRMTEIEADVKRDSNQTAATIELAKTYSSAAVAKIQNDGATERQGMVSMEKILASKDENETKRKNAWLDYEYNVAKLLMEDKGRQQQLTLEAESRDLVAMTKMLRPAGANGGLEITRFDGGLGLSPVDPTATTDSPSVQLAQAQVVTGDGSAQDRLTRAATNAKPSMASKLSQFRGGRGATAITIPKMVLASTNLERATAQVRGSYSTKLLSLPEAKTASLGSSTTLRAMRGAKRSYPGTAHGAIGRNAQPSGGSGEDGHHHSH